MPFGSRLVLVASVLFPAHASGNGETSVIGAVRGLCPSKGEADNRGAKPKPAGLELPSAGAERGNYPEAKPKREGLAGGLACTTASYSALWPKVLMHCPLHRQQLPLALPVSNSWNRTVLRSTRWTHGT
jgi:hypothetical protein